MRRAFKFSRTRMFALLFLAVSSLQRAPMECPGAFGATILLVKSHELPAYSQAAQGFVARWRTEIATDVVEEHTVQEATRSVLTSSGPKLAAIIAVGSEAARWAIRNTDRPVVFCMVANARQSLLDGLSATDRSRVTGVGLNLPVREQFAAIRDVLPHVRRIGILYDPTKTAPTIQEAVGAASSLGLELVVRAVRGDAELPDATDWIGPRIDVLWAPVDSTVYNSKSAQFVLTRMFQRKVPVIGFSENMVRGGALMAPVVSYSAMGEQTALLLRTMLGQGNPARAVPAETPSRFELIVNNRVNRLLGSLISQRARRHITYLNED